MQSVQLNTGITLPDASTQAVDVSQEIRDVIIIGSGPAGYTAAIYAARAQLKPLVFEGQLDAGGALMTTTEVENFPGFSKGIQGPDLMAEMRAQVERFGAELVAEDVESVDLSSDIKLVTDSRGTQHRARTVILAMGSPIASWEFPMRKPTLAEASAGVQPVTVSSTRARTSPWSVEAIPRSRRPLS